MKRRTLVRKLGAAGIGAATLSGSASAQRPPLGDVAVDRELDVAAVDGEVALAELLEPHEVAALSGPDLSRRVRVDAAVDTITIQDCCTYCPWTAVEDCDQLCSCCVEDCSNP